MERERIRARTTMTNPVADKTDLLARLRANAESIRACGVERLELFGSFVRGEAGPESDVDFVVEFRTGEKTYDHLLDLGDLLEEILQRRVELLTRESLSPYIGPRILAEVEGVALGS